MPGEKFTCNRADGPLANDGGQMGGIQYAADLAGWKSAPGNERGDLVAYDNQPTFLYVAGDATKAYNRAKVTQCLRQIVFIRPHTFVMLDRVTSTRAEYEKTWLLHSLSEPKVENAGFTVTEGRGKLTVQTLLPEKAKTAAIHGYGYHGQKFDPPKGSQNGLDASWRVEVTPTAPAISDLFLHVLQTEDSPSKATLVRKPGLVGASGGNWEVLFDDKGGNTVTIAGKVTPIKLGLKPGKFE
jgi:hypothetical protein